jgi:hypothetical protein
MYIFAYSLSFFSHVTLLSCPTCIGNLYDEATPAFFSEELYKQPQLVGQNSNKQLEELLEHDRSEQEQVHQPESE